MKTTIKSKFQVVMEFIGSLIMAGVTVFVALTIADAIKALAEAIITTG